MSLHLNKENKYLLFCFYFLLFSCGEHENGFKYEDEYVQVYFPTQYEDSVIIDDNRTINTWFTESNSGDVLRYSREDVPTPFPELYCNGFLKNYANNRFMQKRTFLFDNVETTNLNYGYYNNIPFIENQLKSTKNQLYKIFSDSNEVTYNFNKFFFKEKAILIFDFVTESDSVEYKNIFQEFKKKLTFKDIEYIFSRTDSSLKIIDHAGDTIFSRVINGSLETCICYPSKKERQLIYDNGEKVYDVLYSINKSRYSKWRTNAKAFLDSVNLKLEIDFQIPKHNNKRLSFRYYYLNDTTPKKIKYHYFPYFIYPEEQKYFDISIPYELGSNKIHIEYIEFSEDPLAIFYGKRDVIGYETLEIK